VLRGEPSSKSFAVFYFHEGSLISVDAVNAPAEFLTAKKLIAAGAKILPETVQDTSVSMKEIMAGALA
jgi:3-phenylpropionate/trans-cinnamate dioxygenase ferredoxin reductase subunit